MDGVCHRNLLGGCAPVTGSTQKWQPTASSSLVVVGAVVVFAVVLGFLLWLGTVAAPNNLDAMNYHLPRAAEWATNHNVNNYPTNIAKQLYNGRLAEYFQTQILILDGTDRLVFMPQFVAYAVSSVLVAGLARQLGGGRRAALWGLLLAATLPLAILQSTTAQTDLVVASIVMATYYLSVVWWNQDHFHVTLLFLIALSAGLAILTKEDAALTLAPLAVVMMIEAVHNHWTTAPAFGWTAVALVLCVVVTLPMGLRNWQLYGNPGGPSGGVDISSIQPAGIATAAGESLLLNLDTLTYGGNIHIFHFESSLGRLLGWNHPDLNVAYSEPDENYFPVWPVLEPAPSEDGSGDLVAFVAVLGALLLLLSAQVRSNQTVGSKSGAARCRRWCFTRSDPLHAQMAAVGRSIPTHGPLPATGLRGRRLRRCPRESAGDRPDHRGGRSDSGSHSVCPSEGRRQAGDQRIPRTTSAGHVTRSTSAGARDWRRPIPPPSTKSSASTRCRSDTSPKRMTSSTRGLS